MEADGEDQLLQIAEVRLPSFPFYSIQDASLLVVIIHTRESIIYTRKMLSQSHGYFNLTPQLTFKVQISVTRAEQKAGNCLRKEGNKMPLGMSKENTYKGMTIEL